MDLLGIPEPPDPPVVNDSIPAGWFILAVLIAVMVFEIWAIKAKKHTISQTIQRLSKGHGWFRWLALAGLGILTWHILWGFPWQL